MNRWRIVTSSAQTQKVINDNVSCADVVLDLSILANTVVLLQYLFK